MILMILINAYRRTDNYTSLIPVLTYLRQKLNKRSWYYQPERSRQKLLAQLTAQQTENVMNTQNTPENVTFAQRELGYSRSYSAIELDLACDLMLLTLSCGDHITLKRLVYSYHLTLTIS